MRAAALAVCLCAPPLLAAEPSPPPPVWSGEASLSFVEATGNSDNRSLGGGGKLLYQSAPWKVEMRGAFIRVETNDVDSAKRSGAALRGERALGPRLAVYSQAGYLRDVFAGIDGQTILEGGLLYKLATGPRHLLALSAAVAYTDESRIAASADRSFAAGRTGVSYKLKIGAASELSEDADYLVDFDDSEDWRANAVTALSASMSRVLAIKLSHQLAYINAPVFGKKKTDTILLASIVAKWPAPPPAP